MEDFSKVKGRIFNIQKFSIHDGPGIRTIVFLKGCKLRCKWCCNPESQSKDIQTMVQDGRVKTVGYDIEAGEVIADVLKDMPYYRRSGGGLTLSGGEMLCQPEFSKALLRLAKENGISTAVETTAYADWETIKELLPYIDTVLVDIKHTDREKHREYTGVYNDLILENIKKMCSVHKNVTVRVPTVPSVNANEKDIESIARFAAEAGAKELHLLPYHRLGQDKYDGLKREYALKEITPPEDKEMEKLRAAAQKYITCVIGG